MGWGSRGRTVFALRGMAIVSGLARPRLWAIVFLISVLLSLTGLAMAGRAAAQGAGGDCPVTAMAQGVDITLTGSDNAATEAPSGVGVPVTQACVSSGL